jgi:TRAP-type mannitol/chloroaromatic compound transport system permease large subunit
MSSWGIAAWLMLGGSTVLLFIGMPVALTFITINLIGAWLYMGGEPGLMQLARSSVSSVTAFSLTPIPLFVLMGEILFHTGLALKVIEGVERLIKHVPGRWRWWPLSPARCSRRSRAPPSPPRPCWAR